MFVRLPFDRNMLRQPDGQARTFLEGPGRNLDHCSGPLSGQLVGLLSSLIVMIKHDEHDDHHDHHAL